MSGTTGIRDRAMSAQCSSIGELVVWTLAAASIPFVAPVVAVFVLRPGFLTIIAAMAWAVVAYAVMAYAGGAWVVEGGPMRRIGAAVILGEALGIVLFAACVYLAFPHTGAGSN